MARRWCSAPPAHRDVVGGGPAMTTTYELRVEGQLDSHWSGVLGSAFLGGLSLSHDGDGTSTLTCPVADQAQLQACSPVSATSARHCSP